MNLFVQFCRAANSYFFFICVLQSIPAVSITKGIPTTAAPLAFILAVGMFKAEFEDFQRHKADDVENARKTTRCDPVGSEQVAWRDLHVGNVGMNGIE